MEQYIKKSDVIKEINEFIQALENSCTPNPFGNTVECMTAAEIEALNLVKESIDDIQTKEVDFEKESEMWIKENQDTAGFFNLVDYAKHCFELGLKMNQKGE